MNILQMSKAALPFLLLMVVLILIITVVPQVVTWLPNVLDS